MRTRSRRRGRSTIDRRSPATESRGPPTSVGGRRDRRARRRSRSRSRSRDRVSLPASGLASGRRGRSRFRWRKLEVPGVGHLRPIVSDTPSTYDVVGGKFVPIATCKPMHGRVRICQLEGRELARCCLDAEASRRCSSARPCVESVQVPRLPRVRRDRSRYSDGSTRHVVNSDAPSAGTSRTEATQVPTSSVSRVTRRERHPAAARRAQQRSARVGRPIPTKSAD